MQPCLLVLQPGGLVLVSKEGPIENEMIDLTGAFPAGFRRALAALWQRVGLSRDPSPD